MRHELARNIVGTRVKNGTFHSGEIVDHALDRVFDDRKLFFVVGNGSTLFSGNGSFSIAYRDHNLIHGRLRDIFSSGNRTLPNMGLLSSSDIGDTMASIGRILTYALAHGPSASLVAGQSLYSEQHVRVNWWWIILPLAEVYMGMTLLVCTIIHTWLQGVAVWKSSAIVPMLTNIDGWNSKDVRDQSVNDLEKNSKSMRGILVLCGPGAPIFRRVDK